MSGEGEKSDIAPQKLFELWRSMARIRIFEERLADLVEAGEVRCPCHLSIGQEAVAAGVCAALERDDTIWGGHRSHGHYLAKGGSARAMMAEVFGKETGCAGGRGGSMHLLAREVGILGTVPIVAATIPLAVGAALASRLRRDGRIAVAFFGDGATGEGHFHESLNLASLYRLPALFVCENNLYSSHLSLLEHRAKDNIHESGPAHGVPGVVLDGNDVVEVYRAAGEAGHRAREGLGPTLLECRTYRFRGHVGPSWDTDVGVKRKDEFGEWLPRDPVARARCRLEKAGMREEVLQRAEEEARREVEEAVAFARESPYPAERSLLDHVFRAGERQGPCGS